MDCLSLSRLSSTLFYRILRVCVGVGVWVLLSFETKNDEMKKYEINDNEEYLNKPLN